MNFKCCPIAHIEKIKKCRRRIQLGYGGIVLTYFGQEKGFLISIKEYLKLAENSDIDIAIENEMSLNFFIDLINKGLKRTDILDDLFNQSAISLTFQTREIMAFVNFKYVPYLSIPMASSELC